MTEHSTKMQWPFPSANEDPWYDNFVSMVGAMDVSSYAAREDRQMILMGGGVLTWNATTGVLAWGGSIRVSAPITGFAWLVAAGNVTLADGEVLYAVVSRGPLSVVTVSTGSGSTVPDTDGAVVLAVRNGSDIWWRNGVMMSDGDTLPSLGSLAAHAPTSIGMAFNETLSTAVPGPVIVGGSVFDGGKFKTGTLKLTLVGAYTATGTVGSCVIRLYDRGAPGSPVAGDLRSTVTIAFAAAGNVDAFTSTLSVLSAPGVGVDEVGDTERVYEVEAEIVGSDGASDIFKLHKASVEVS